MQSSASARGFTLLETLVATGIVVTAVAGLAQLVAFSAGLTRASAESAVALAAAQQKLEALRALEYSFDAGGFPTVDPQLAPARYVDWLDASGVEVEEADAALVRRWQVTTLEAAEPSLIAIEVCVFDARARIPDACLATLRTRQP
jgi:type II secretory pathway pseudopilin PulG